MIVDKENCKGGITTVATVADLERLLVEQKTEYARSALIKDGWSDDPGTGGAKERVRGQFAYADDYMKRLNVGDVVGNIVNLQPDYAWGQYDGTELDFESYLRGDANCLGRVIMPQAEDGERVMRIAVGIGGNCMISAEDLVKRAATTLKVAAEYTAAGYDVELFAFNAISDTAAGRYGRANVVIIDCSRAAMGQAVSMMASAKIFRSLVFDLICHHHKVPSCGYPINKTQNSNRLGEVEEIIRQELGANTRIVHAGCTLEQVKDAMQPNALR